MDAAITAVDYHLPEAALTNADLAREYPAWGVDKIRDKTGIETRRLAGPQECASDLAVAAARRLFERGVCAPEQIDFLLLCTQSPDYFLPTTACLLQDRLGLRTSAGALDFNLGCSGYIYGLGLAKGLIETRQARRVLLLTAETYSKFIAPDDRSVRTIFGDGAAATLIEAGPRRSEPAVGPFVYGTDGRGAENLIVERGGMRCRTAGGATEPRLYMNGPEILAFTLDAVPECVNELLRRTERTLDTIDLFVFHQANRYMLEHLRDALQIAPERFYIALTNQGNTVSASIPIALRCAELEGRLRAGMTVALVGFGVGYSWGAALVRWQG